MHIVSRKVRQIICTVLSLAFIIEPMAASAAQLNIVKSPMFVAPPIPPIVMLAMSKDHALFKAAYTDYNDLDGDGVIDTTYKHSINYYGYFDTYKCYTYGTSSLSGASHFIPSSWTSDKYCDGTKWSGNFLNWVTMSRMDTVRKLLFGGARSTDNATPSSGYGSLTILDRTHLPTDAHSWAKYYNGNDINRLTPFNPPTAPTPSVTFTDAYSCGSVNTSGPIPKGTWIYICSLPDSFYSSLQLGDQVKFSTPDGTKNIIGRVGDFDRPGGINNYVGIVFDGVAGVDASGNSLLGNAATNINTWVATNLSSVGISFCNTTLGASGTMSQTNSNPPLMRVVRGNYELWSSNERWQCYLREERSSTLGWASSNGNQLQVSGSASSAENPSKNGYAYGSFTTDARGLGVTDYNVRVEACHNAFYPTPVGQSTTEKCKQYDQAGYFKPVGLLQIYGDNGAIQFGMVTGSYTNNVSGGTLRKNVANLSSEITSSGVFTNDPTGGNIIRNLSRFRIYGYDYTDGTYINSTGDNCPYQMTSVDLVNGRCRSWGNPMSEIYMETLRYLAGANAPTSAFYADDSTLMPSPRIRTATWPNPNTVLSNSNYCAPLNILAFNTSTATKDADEVANPFVGVSGTPVGLTNTVGTSEGLNGASIFIGNNGVTNNQLCSAKSLSGGSATFGNAQGICPDAPSLNGSYLMSGLAYAARTNRIRNDLTAVPANDLKSLKVSTYGISLATNTPRIEITVPSGPNAGKKVVLQPIYRLDLGTKFGAGAIVNVKITKLTPTSGSMYIVWEDSEMGGDYDQDVTGVISWNISGNTIQVTTGIVSMSTANPQGFGYAISGTTQDGPHFHSGILGFNYTDSQNISVTPASSPGALNTSGGCQNCQATSPYTTATYTISSSPPAIQPNDPLWYSAKYGSFTDKNGNGLPDLASEWDVVVNNTGVPGSDGIPDTFFAVNNPLGLENALNKLFVSILQASAASAVAANSQRLNTGVKIYQAVFSPADWSSKLYAFSVDPVTGAPASNPDWDAGQVSLNPATINPSARRILTFNKDVTGAAPRGILFNWPANPAAPTTSELTPSQIAALNLNPNTLINDNKGSSRLNYIRGDGSNEGTGLGNFRQRLTSKLGDIISSNPNFQGPPASGYTDPAYRTFVATYANRKPMLYVGANDGMLHGFDASVTGTTGGQEVFAYIPSPVYRNLSKLTSQTYSHEYFVDGSPAVEDAYVYDTNAGGNVWKTVLVGGLGRGGQGIYALDVTDSSNLSTANPNRIALWEFTDADDPDLGYTYGTPLIRQMRDGSWVAIVAGGYNNSQGVSNDPAEVQCTSGSGTIASPYLPAGCTTSRTGFANIFILKLSGPTGTNGKWVLGTDYWKLSTGTGSVGTPNGFGGVLAVEITGDGKVDYLYAGDLNGSLWKFDVSSSTQSNWGATGNVVNLFTAVDGSSNPQPITSTPDAVVHPSGQGLMVTFGTGKYLEATDINPPGPAYTTQTIYGIWDKNNSSPISGQTVISGRSVLMPQLLQPGINNIVTNTDGTVSRITTAHLPNDTGASRDDSQSWDGMGSTNLYALLNARSNVSTTPANQLGWYLDLFNGGTSGSNTLPSGERVIYSPVIRGGIVVYSSIWPQSNVCLGLTSGDNIALRVTTGQRPDSPVFDTTSDGNVNTTDMVTVGTDSNGNPIKLGQSSQRIVGGAAQPPTFVAKGANYIGYQNATSGGLSYNTYQFNRQAGRISWREIMY